MSRSPLPEDQGPTFDPRTHWCERHLMPFKDRWPEGWGLAMLALFQECIGRKDIQSACTSPGESEADARMLDRVLLEFSPLCCLVGDETTAKWTALSLGPMEGFQKELAALKASQG